MHGGLRSQAARSGFAPRALRERLAGDCGFIVPEGVGCLKTAAHRIEVVAGNEASECSEARQRGDQRTGVAAAR